MNILNEKYSDAFKSGKTRKIKNLKLLYVYQTKFFLNWKTVFTAWENTLFKFTNITLTKTEF